MKELRQTHQQMHRLTAAGRLLQHLDLDTLLTEIMQCVLETVEAQVGAIMVVENDVLQPRVAWGPR